MFMFNYKIVKIKIGKVANHETLGTVGQTVTPLTWNMFTECCMESNICGKHTLSGPLSKAIEEDKTISTCGLMQPRDYECHLSTTYTIKEYILALG